MFFLVDGRDEVPEATVEHRSSARPDPETVASRVHSFRFLRTHVYLSIMKSQQPTVFHTVIRRRSKLSQQLADEKIERARRQTPEERLTIALSLSDFCYLLNRCSPKP